MSFDNLMIIASFVGLVACMAGFHYLQENVKLTYKDQRVGYWNQSDLRHSGAK